MAFVGKTLSSLASDPLFSTIIAFCTLILLYFPNLFRGILFSPILISTSVLLLSLLRLGAIQRSSQEKKRNERQEEKDSKTAEVNSTQQSTHDSIIEDCKRASVKMEKDSSTDFNSTQQPLNHPTHDLIIDDHKRVSSNSSESSDCEEVSVVVPSGKPFYSDSFVEWDVRAPLEVIYEAYEGEEEEEDEENEDVSEGKREAQMAIIDRYASLSKFYPETDSDISSEEDFLAIRDWDCREHMWEGEDKEGLIEIELGEKRHSVVEEENFIEIDLYPASFPAR